MLKTWCPFLLFILFVSCENDLPKSDNLTNFLPPDTSVYFEGENLESIKQQIKGSNFIGLITTSPSNEELKSLLSHITHFKSENKAVLGFSKTADREMIFSLIVRADSTLFARDSIQNIMVETLKSGKNIITKYTIEDYNIYLNEKNGIHYYSNDEKLTWDFSTLQEKKLPINRFQKLKSDAATLVFTSNTKQQFPLKLFLNDTLNKLKIADRLYLNYIENNSEIYGNGIFENLGSSKSFIDIFQNTISQQNRFADIAPDDIDYALSITFDDREVISKNLREVFPKDSLIEREWLFNNTIEIAQISKNSENAVFLQTLDPSTSLSNLSRKDLVETYRDIEIYRTNEDQSPFSDFDDIFQFLNYQYFITIDDFFLFADSLSFLKDAVSSFQNGKTLSKSETFEGIMQNMSDESSVFIYYNGEKLNQLVNLNFEEEFNLGFKSSEKSAVQLISDSDYAHLNAVLRKSGKTSNRTPVYEQLQTSIDSEIINGPYFLENGITKNMDYYVQDINNQLYVFDNSGKLQFKKLLDGTILGKIEQLDSFKNGRQQLAFSTSTTLYMLSREGKDVSNFPIKFNDKITQPLSVFDYDNNKRYRLLVTQGKELLMLDKDGKRVNGFTFKPSSKLITSQPKHIRIGRKDYIVYTEEDKIRILFRTGKDRLRVGSKFEFSDNGIYEFQDNFTFTDQEGNLVQIDENGRITKEKLTISGTHKFISTSRTDVVLSDNILKIRSNSVELDFGNYTEPSIFYLNDKIYVSVTDLQANKVFLYDSQAKLISGFPVYGSSSVDMGKIDKDNNLELIVRSGTNAVIIYQLN